MFNKKDVVRNALHLFGPLASQGYDWWWHSFTARDAETNEEQAFFIEYFIINPALAEAEPTFGQDPANKAAGKRPSYVMVKAGAWGKNPTQLHRFFSVKDVLIAFDAPYALEVADCIATETRIAGSVSVSPDEAAAHPEWMCDSGSMAWDLEVDKQIAFNVGYGASTALRATNAFEMYWHAQGMKTAFTGTVLFNGRRYTVDPKTCYGYADKNWGADFTSPWVWLSSNHLVSTITGKKLENTVFDIGGGKPRVMGVGLDRKLLSAMYYEGEEFEFNFSKPQELVHTVFDGRETETHIVWDVVQTSLKGAMDVHIECPKAEMVLANYEAPSGSKRHNRLWNGGTGTGTVKLYRREPHGLLLVDDMQVFNVGCEYGEFDTD